MSTDSSPGLHAIALAGVPPVGLSHEAGYWIDTSCIGFMTSENPVLRAAVPGEALCQEVEELCQELAEDTADPVDPSTSAAPEEASPEEIRSRAIADVVDAGLLETILAAKAAKVKIAVRSRNSPAYRDFYLDEPKKGRRHLVRIDRSVDWSSFTASGEGYPRCSSKRSLPPVYVDALTRYLSRSREEMAQELEQCLIQRTQQLYQAVTVIKDLMQERGQLEGKAVRLDQNRRKLKTVRAALEEVRREMLNRKTKR